jgi:hypothetical protein
MRIEKQTRIKALSHDISGGGAPALSPLEALALIQSAIAEKCDAVPEGWYTAVELATAWGLQHAQTSRKIRSAIDAGIAEKRIFRVKCSSIVRLVPHFRFHARPLAQTAPTSLAS